MSSHLNILLLPTDIIINIFMKLQITDLPNVMRTCKTFRDLLKNDNSLWRSLMRGRFILRSGTYKSSHNQISWYHRCRSFHNWSNGYYRSKTLLTHYTNYMPWIKFHNSEVLLLTVGSKLHCYPTNKYNLPNCRYAQWMLDVPKVNRHDVRTNDISRFVVKNQLIVCGNRDGCVAIYRINNVHRNNSNRKPKLLWHLKDCHQNGFAEVTAVEFVENRNQLLVVTGSNDSPDLMMCSLSDNNDQDVRIYDSNKKYGMTYIPIEDGAGIKCMALNNCADKLAIGLNGNSKPLLLDINNQELVWLSPTTNNYKLAVRDIQWHNENTIIYVTHSGFLQCIDIRTQEMIYNARDPFQSTLYCVKSDGGMGIVVGSAEYSRCVLYDARNQTRHVQMYFTQKKTSPVYSLDFDCTKLITAVDRGVAVLNFNVDPSNEEQKDYSHIFH